MYFERETGLSKCGEIEMDANIYIYTNFLFTDKTLKRQWLPGPNNLLNCINSRSELKTEGRA